MKIDITFTCKDSGRLHKLVGIDTPNVPNYSGIREFEIDDWVVDGKSFGESEIQATFEYGQLLDVVRLYNYHETDSAVVIR